MELACRGGNKVTDCRRKFISMAKIATNHAIIIEPSAIDRWHGDDGSVHRVVSVRGGRGMAVSRLLALQPFGSQ
eukprot:347451-Pyramimonas_sp.AAC.1